MSEENLNTKIEFIRGVGPQKASLLNKELNIYTLNDRGVAPGQSAVFYKDNLCLGGGVIEARTNDL